MGSENSPRGSIPSSVIDAYSFVLRRAASVEFLAGAGGFSGAMFWKVQAGEATYCLRRWPAAHPSVERLTAIHLVLERVEAAGHPFVPLPIETSAGASFVAHAGNLWELSRWLPGEASYHCDPSAARLDAAMEGLAQFHQAVCPAQEFPCSVQDSPGSAERFDPNISGGENSPERIGLPFRSGDLLARWYDRAPSAGLQSRAALVRRLMDGGLDRLSLAISQHRAPLFDEAVAEVISCARELIGLLAPSIEEASRLVVPIQPCIRDIWHDHLLFQGEQLTGIVDFGAMRGDSVAGDLARLLGSLVGDDASGWQQGLRAYQQVRPLDLETQSLIGLFDRSAVLLSGIQWIEWLYVENRQFSQPAKIVDRLRQIVRRMHCLRADEPHPAD